MMNGAWPPVPGVAPPAAVVPAPPVPEPEATTDPLEPDPEEALFPLDGRLPFAGR